MAEPAPRTETDQGTPPRMPRWVKVASIVVGVLVLVFVILKLTGIGGEHGPARHMSGGTPLTVGTASLATAPADAVPV